MQIVLTGNGGESKSQNRRKEKKRGQIGDLSQVGYGLQLQFPSTIPYNLQLMRHSNKILSISFQEKKNIYNASNVQ